MARKKQEIQLLREIESQEEWEDIMAKEGLWVVDVFQEWSGPCDAMVSNFRRIKNELGDDLLHFAMAKSDTIEALEKYRGSCEPCFLFFAAGVLVAYVHGANAPLILRTLTEQLAQEHKVLDGTAERKEVKDPFVASREMEAEQKEEEEEGEDGEGYVPHRRVSTMPEDYIEDAQKFAYNDELVIFGDLTPAEEYEEVEEGYTVAIIKPNVVADGKVDDVLAEMQAKGIKVLAQEERQLTEDEAREFYAHLQGEEYFEDLVKFMSSGPSHVLVLTKGQADDSIIKDWRDMLGPPAVEDAKELAPESLRAKYGAAGLMNALHGSDSKETAARELAFFFPNMQAPTMQLKKKEVQRTLALIRPDAFAANRDAILEKIKEAGFRIALQKELTLTKEQAEEFYHEHAGQPYFDELTIRMSSGPLMALGLAREDAVEGWRELLGPVDVEEAKTVAPDSLRAQFALEDVPINQLHGSDSAAAAEKELEFFFPVEQTVALIKPDAYGTKDAIIDKIHEAGFRIAARKETTITRDIAEKFYEDQKDKEYFNDLVEHMTSGPTMFMVLSREGAVEGWRETIGPTDPEQAKLEAPDSLRAMFGTDVLHNAVHGCSSKEQAQYKIETVFGSLDFNPDGTVREPAQEQEEQAEIGTPGTEAADVAPEYRQQAEQQEQQQPEEQKTEEQQQEQQKPAEEQQPEEQQQQQQEEQKPEEQKPEEQKPEDEPKEEQKPEEQKPEDEPKEEQKPADEPQEEQKEGERKQEEEVKEEQQPKAEEKTESEEPQKPSDSEAQEEGAGKTEEEQKPSEEKEEGAGRDPEVESSHSGIDLEAEHLSAADIYARTADSSGKHDGRTTPVDNTEEPANSVDTDPGETVTAEQPVDSPRETVTAEQPVDSPRETVTAEQAVDSPREMVTAEQPVDSPRETVTAEQAVDSPRETVTAEQAVGDSVHNEDTDKKSESLASDVENADTTEEINEDGLDMEENGDDGTHDAEPVTYIPEDAEEHGDEPDCGHHEEDKVTDVAVDQGAEAQKEAGGEEKPPEEAATEGGEQQPEPAGEQKTEEESPEAKTEEQKEAPAEEPKVEEQKEEGQAEPPKAEEQKEGEAELPKAEEQKEGETAEAKPEGEEAKTEEGGTQQKEETATKN